MPGPRSTTRASTSLRVVVTWTCTDSPSRRELERVLEQVHEYALDLDGVHLDDRWVGGSASSTRRAPGPAGPAPARRAPRSPIAPGSARPRRPGGGRGRADCRPRAPAVPLQPDGLEEARAGRLVQREAGLSRLSAEHSDGGERGAQVVADGLEHGRLDRVTPPQRLGLNRLARQLLPVGRHRHRARRGPAGTGAGWRGSTPAPRGRRASRAGGRLRRARAATLRAEAPDCARGRCGRSRVQHVRDRRREALDLRSGVLGLGGTQSPSARAAPPPGLAARPRVARWRARTARSLTTIPTTR